MHHLSSTFGLVHPRLLGFARRVLVVVATGSALASLGCVGAPVDSDEPLGTVDQASRYSAGHFTLTIDGERGAYLKSVKVETARGEVVTVSPGAQGAPPGEIKEVTIEVQASSVAPELEAWVQEAAAGKSSPHEAGVVVHDDAGESLGRWTFKGAVLTDWSGSTAQTALGSEKKARYFTIKFHPEEVTYQAGDT
jgi:hypothetical protein